jgi:hypothetical protein
MKPSRLSAALRSVADRIDRSKSPSRAAVAAELRSVLASVAGGDLVQNTCSKCGERHIGDVCPTCGTKTGPQKVSASLRSISERILASRNPSRFAVTAELRRVLAAIENKITVNKVTLVPAEEDEEPGMPTFLVEGTWEGEAFAYNVSVELDGRDADWEHVSGSDPNDPDDDQDFEEWMEDGTVAVYDAIYESGEYKRLTSGDGSQ